MGIDRTPRIWPRGPFRSFAAAVLALALLSAGCGGDGDTGGAPSGAESAAVPPANPRSFGMGFTVVPAELSDAAYRGLFAKVAQSGDLVMIQRAVPWAELAPDTALSPEAEATIARERALLDEFGLEVLFAIDPFEPTDRSRLTEGAPGDSFTDAAVVDAYLAYVDLVLDRYHPRWLALAVDVDQIARGRSESFGEFEEAYRRAYNRVKERSPQTLAFATFQLEDLQGLLAWTAPHSPQWQLLLRFSDALDLLAVSTFPSFIFPFATEIPSEYFSRLAAFEKPLALVPVGYASSPGRGGVTYGTVSGQRAFLERLLAEAEVQEWELIVWLAPQDPDYATAPPYDLVARMGLTDARGIPKPAWETWRHEAERPWRPAGEALPLQPEGGTDA